MTHGQPREHGDEPFGEDPWALRETHLDLELLGRSESLFALANGHIGLRGNLDEGEPRGLSGTYLNGFYESYPLAYGERGFGFAEDGQAVVDVTDGKVIRLLVEDEPLDVERGTLEQHERCLDLKTGILTRELVWRSAYGHRVRVKTERLVSFTKRSVAAIRYEVEALDEPLRVSLQSNLLTNQQQPDVGVDDPRTSQGPRNALEHELHAAHGRRVVLAHRTRRSRLGMAAGMDHTCHHEDGGLTEALHAEEDLGRFTVSVQLQPNTPLRIEKLLSYHWSSRQTAQFLRDQVDASLDSALSEGFDGLAAEQRALLDDFWTVGDIEVEGDPQVQQALRFAMFHLLQASIRAEERAIAAKGLTGAGYDGHAFWDTECFVLPVMTFVRPEVVRDALVWRHSTLHQARERARQLGLRGAAFPWRTIHGEECSGYWPAGTAAVHVNADIAAAAARYVLVTQDEEFERYFGCEVLVETARLWCSLGRMDPDGRFRIDGVTGPDEYSALVDNNVFTNLMAQANLLAACEATSKHPDVAERLGVTSSEVETWRAAGEGMFVPYDEERGLHPQDQDYLWHEPWDFEGTDEDQYPLMLHFPYFQLYRKQVIKQADLVLAMQMRGDHFTAEEKRRNFDYYEQLTASVERRATDWVGWARMPPPSTPAAAAPARPRPLATSPGLLWRFGRPHTLIGTSVSVVALFALAADDSAVGAGTAVFHLVLTLLAALAVNVFIVGINQVEDVEIDRINKPELPIAAGELSLGSAKAIVAACGALPVGLAITQGWRELVAVLIALAVGWAYSCPPLRLKRWPIPAATSITVVRAAVVNLGVWWHFSQAFDDSTAVDPAVWVLAAVTVPFAFAIAVLKDVPDLEGDRRHGIRTFTVRLGPARALRLGLAALALAAAGVVVSGFALLPVLAAAVLAALTVAAAGWLLQSTGDVKAFYQRVWRVFFAVYVVIPLTFVIA